MLFILVSALCIAAAASHECFKYDELHGNFKVSLKDTANNCREQHGGTKQPAESKCVMQAYGAIAENWALDCPKFEKFIREYIYDQTNFKNMKQKAITGCGCTPDPIDDEAKRKETGEKFILCWKKGLDDSCPHDTKLATGTI